MKPEGTETDLEKRIRIINEIKICKIKNNLKINF